MPIVAGLERQVDDLVARRRHKSSLFDYLQRKLTERIQGASAHANQEKAQDHHDHLLGLFRGYVLNSNSRHQQILRSCHSNGDNQYHDHSRGAFESLQPGLHRLLLHDFPDQSSHSHFLTISGDLF